MTIDEALKSLPSGWRFNVGHTPHWYTEGHIPKHMRKKPYEAYVLSGEIGTKSWIFESADGVTPADALTHAIKAGLAKEKEKHEMYSRISKTNQKG